MFLYFLQTYFPYNVVTNLFRYISFRIVIAAALSFIFTVFLMPKLIDWLKKKSVKQIVRDDGPQTHLAKTGTPTMGGLIMVIGVVLSSLFLCRLDNASVWISLWVFVGFGAVGFADDYLKLSKKNTKGVSFKAKMITLGLVSISTVFFIFQSGVIAPEIRFPFFKSLIFDIGPWFYLWGYLVLVGASNAVNLTDGLDGLAIVPSMTTALVLLITSYVSGHIIFSNYLQLQSLPGSGELSILMGSLIGVGLGFLWYNAHPAQIFMGDVGSLSIGGLLGIVALLTHQEIILFMAGFLFVMEAVSVMLQVGSYKSTKKRIFKMAPLHHHFELSGWPESKVIVRFWILSILFALVAISTLKIR